MRVCISGAPANGSEIVPEFKALLQALENRSVQLDQRDIPYPYVFLTYTNLQSRFDGPRDESLQTDAIMRLTDRYPLSFKGITIDLDPIKDATALNEELKNKLKFILLSDQTFSLDRVEGIKTNYFLTPTDKEAWKKFISHIINKSYSHVKSRRDIALTNKARAFIHHVNLGIVRFFETSKARQLLVPGQTRKMMTKRLCRRGSDRAMFFNGAFAYIIGQRVEFVALTILARSLLTSGRLILEKQARQLAMLAHGSDAATKDLAFFQEIDREGETIPLVSSGLTFAGYAPEFLPPTAISRAKRRLIFK
jgi:hypothetical protein